MFDSIKNDPVLKVVTIAVLSVLAVGIVFMLLGSLFGANAAVVNGSHSMGYGFNLSFTGILVLLVKLLLFLSIAGASLGAIMYLRQNYSKEIVNKLSSLKPGAKAAVTCKKCGQNASEDFKFCPACGEKLKEECTSCGLELKPEWKCCPGCGSEKT